VVFWNLGTAFQALMPEQGWCLPGKQTMKSLSLYGSQGRCRKGGGGARNKML